MYSIDPVGLFAKVFAQKRQYNIPHVYESLWR